MCKFMAHPTFFCHSFFQNYIDFQNNPTQNGQNTQIRKMKAVIIVKQLFLYRKH